MTDCNHDLSSTSAQHASIARELMAVGALSHAAYHVASAIASDPSGDFDLLDELLRLAPRPMELFDLSSSGLAAVRALLLHRLARHDDALKVLAAVFSTRPNIPYFVWTVDWPPPSSAQVTLKLLERLMSASGAVVSDWKPVSVAVRRWADASAPSLQILALMSIVHRRAGDHASARDAALRSIELEPTWAGCVALASANMALGDELGMIAAWDRALDLQPDDLSVHLAWGDWLLGQGRWAEAISRFQHVLDVEPEHLWGFPSQLYARYKQHPTVQRRLALRSWARATPESERAQRLSDELTPWLGWLPTSGEASLRVLLSDIPDDRQVHLRVDYLESASLMLELADADRVNASWSDVPEPDPREPRMQGVRPLWTWDELEPSPALPFPPREVREQVARLAIHRYDARRWARQIVDEPKHDAWQVLAAAQHPSDAEGVAPWAWRYHLALAAGALLASRVGWHGTEHREAMRAMIATRSDWLTLAGLAALIERAERDSACREDAQSWLAACWNDAPSEGHWIEGWLVTDGLVRLGAEEQDLQDYLLPALRHWEEPEPEA